MVNGIKELLSMLMYTDDDDEPKKLTAFEQFESEIDLSMPTPDLARVHDSIIAVMEKSRLHLKMYESATIDDANEVIGDYKDIAYKIAKELLSRELSRSIRTESRKRLVNEDKV